MPSGLAGKIPAFRGNKLIPSSGLVIYVQTSAHGVTAPQDKHRRQRQRPNITTEWVTFQLEIRKVSGSGLGPDIDYPQPHNRQVPILFTHFLIHYSRSFCHSAGKRR
jgi:hypothetical protein